MREWTQQRSAGHRRFAPRVAPAGCVGLLLAVLLFGQAMPAAAQDPEPFMAKLTAAWTRGDAQAITELADQTGISLEVDGREVGSITPRQAAAVLRRIFDGQETVRVTAGSLRRLPGNETRAYAEIIWERRPRGTTQTQRANVFVALSRDAAGWRITEIRLMP